MENNKSSSSSRPDRKTIEKNRRDNMKALCLKLSSLIPPDRSRGVTSLPDQLQEATNYIKNLQADLDSMKEKKESLQGKERKRSSMRMITSKIEMRETGSGLEIVVVTGLDSQFMFNETIRILHEEGAEILTANYSAIDDAVFHTIHAKMGECSSSTGAASLFERLKNLFEI